MASLLIGRSACIKCACAWCARYAPRRRSAVITGATGTGKSVVVAELHRLSPWADQPLVRIASGELTASNIQDVLAGHVKGGFTDAVEARRGLLVAAAGGTAFFDDLQDLLMECQSYLLDALERRALRPVGADRGFIPDVRFVFGTQMPLAQLVKTKRLKPDLAQRIGGTELILLPLRQHSEDVHDLAPHLLDRIADFEGLAALATSARVMEALLGYSWPGNVRELEDVLSEALIEASADQAGVIDLRHLPDRVIRGTRLAAELRSASREEVLAALESSDWVVTRTASRLDLDRRTVQRKIREFDIVMPQRRGVRHSA